MRVQHHRLWWLTGVCAGLVLWMSPATAGDWSFSGEISPQVRLFIEAPKYGNPTNPDILQAQSEVREVSPNFYFPYTGQSDQRLWASIAGNFTAEYEWNDGDDKLVMTPFGRLAQNDVRRTHWDMREANWLHVGNDWDSVVGFSKVFWGVTESRHIVDVVNQKDQVEDIDGDEKLGQPMINGNFFGDWGRLSLFYLPYFRERTFESNNARFRGPLPIDVDGAEFESGMKQWHPDFAARYERTFGDLDLGLSAFDGTSRDPGYNIEFRRNGVFTVPTYGQLTQLGLDALYTYGDWLWKLEAVQRWGPGGDEYVAAVGGFEYTFANLWESNKDVGILLEYNYDGRREPPPALFPFSKKNARKAKEDLARFVRNPTRPLPLDGRFGQLIDDGRVIEYNDGVPPEFFTHDLFIGTRLAFNDENDTSLLIGALIDVENRGTYLQFEGTHRLSDNWTAEVEGRFFIDIPESDTPLFYISSDSFLQAQAVRHF